jgi:hypothetical protein
MQTCKDIALVALGATAVLMYQKYHEPVMRKMECAANKMMRKADKVLDDML